jgi:Ca-activated chloride channel family protein
MLIPLCSLLFLLVSEGVCLGGGILYVTPPKLDKRTVAVARPICQLSKTLVTVSESYVEFRTNQVFLNDNDYPLDGIFIFPLPRDKSVRITEVLINGNNEAFDTIEAKELFPLLKKITVATEEPSTMAIANGPALVINSTKLNIRESISFRIAYRIPLKITDSVLDINVDMTGERYALSPIGEFEILTRFKMSRPIRSSISPSHRISVEKESNERRLVSVREREIRRPSDFRLLTSVGGIGLDVKLLFYPSTKKGGHFLAMVEPPLSWLDKRQPSLDLAILLDCSGSIGIEHVKLGKRAISLFLGKLRPLDRFEMMKITSRPRRLFGRLVEAMPQRISDGFGFLSESDDGDGTDLYNGILYGLETLSSKKRRSSMILLISDGKSTIGKTGSKTLIEMIRRYNKNGTRIFVLALGNSPDLITLDHIAATTGGSVFNAVESADFEEGINKWLSSIISPKVVDLVVSLKDLDPELVFPEPIPEILGQDSVVITGLYRKVSGSDVSLSVKGKIEGNTDVGIKKFEVSSQETPYNFIPSLWAMRRMANLLDLERTKGLNHSSEELIRGIADSFGFEICEDHLGCEQAFSKLLWRYKTSFIPEEVTRKEYRRIGNRLFKHMNGCWNEIDVKTSMIEHNILFLSKEYFDFIKLNSGLAPIVALGPQVTFQHNDQLVKIINSLTQEDHEEPKIQKE